MDTYFAPATRASAEELKLDIQNASQNPVIDGLMRVVGGSLAVLNEHRQIVALNKTLLARQGVATPEQVLGLRVGEMFHCIHAHESPGGCGTSKYCSQCGAARAIMTSLEQDRPVERTCAMTVNGAGEQRDLYLNVRSCPIWFNERRLLLLFLQDITRQQQLAMLERVFFHDITNTITGLVGVSELLSTSETEKETGELAVEVHQLARRLAQEVKIQQCLAQTDTGRYPVSRQELSLQQVFNELRQMFHNHPAAKDKLLDLPTLPIDWSFETDLSLLLRVLGNMVTNALEASGPGDAVKVWLDPVEGGLVFLVWNKQAIPADIARRVFQRNFSTKAELGRGLGTYSMKLFGEELLGGQVDFTTSESDGTTFRFVLPD